MENWFNELNAIDVNDHIKQKNGLNYLSWMWAWSELKKKYPLSYATVHETDDGMIVWRDPIGGHVKTSVTIVWKEDGDETLHTHTATEYLPVMDFRNKAIPFENIDSTNVNKTIQRSLTKCIARLGLGAYIYVNEDMPEDMSKIKELKVEIKDLVAKKCASSENAKSKVAELCKNAEKEANPDLDEDMISGNYNNINDVDILTNLKKHLLAVRK